MRKLSSVIRERVIYGNVQLHSRVTMILEKLDQKTFASE